MVKSKLRYVKKIMWLTAPHTLFDKKNATQKYKICKIFYICARDEAILFWFLF